MTSEPTTITLTREDEGNEIITLTRDGDEIREVYTLDGAVLDESWQAQGPGGASDIDEWLHRRLIDLRADGYREA